MTDYRAELERAARVEPAPPRRHRLDVDAARNRLLLALRKRPGEWRALSDHQLARLAGLTDADQGAQLLRLLVADDLVQVANPTSEHRRIRFGGAAHGARRAEALVREADRQIRAAPPPSPPTRQPEEEPVPNAPASKFVGFTAGLDERHALARRAQAAKLTVPGLVRAALRAGEALPGDEALRSAIERAADRARAENVEVGRLIAELIDAGLTLRAAARPLGTLAS